MRQLENNNENGTFVMRVIVFDNDVDVANGGKGVFMRGEIIQGHAAICVARATNHDSRTTPRASWHHGANFGSLSIATM